MAKKNTILPETENDNESLGDANDSDVVSNESAPAEEEAKEEQSGYLKPEVAKVFDLNWTGGHTMQAGRHGRIDLRALTLEDAERLVKNGFTVLVRKK